MKYEELKQKIIKLFKENGWYYQLRLFLLSNQFDEILVKLCEDINNGNHWFPPLSKVFNAFRACNPENYKALIIDAVHYDKIEERHNWYPTLNTVNYTELGNQGVLVLQTRITNGRGLNHEKLWLPFVKWIAENTNPKFILNNSSIELEGDNVINEVSTESVNKLRQML